MKNSFLILAGAAALSLSSCSQEKTTETTVTTEGTETTGTTMSAADMDAMVQARAQRVADKMVADMKITDDATKERIRTVYVTRAQKIGTVRSQYTTDTTGMAAAIREANAATDAEFKTIFTDPAQYQAYESSRNTYYSMEDEEPSVDAMSSDNMSSTDMSSTTTSDGASVDKMKSKTDDTKVKVKSDGDVKIKDAEGNKLKVDGDDGTVKAKPEDGEKAKIK